MKNELDDNKRKIKVHIRNIVIKLSTSSLKPSNSTSFMSGGVKGF